MLIKQIIKSMKDANVSYVNVPADGALMAFAAEIQPYSVWSGACEKLSCEEDDAILIVEYYTVENGDVVSDPRCIFRLRRIVDDFVPVLPCLTVNERCGIPEHLDGRFNHPEFQTEFLAWLDGGRWEDAVAAAAGAR